MCVVQSEVLPAEACSFVPDIEEGLLNICSDTVLVGADFYYMPYQTRIRAVNDYGDGVLSGIVDIMSAEESECLPLLPSGFLLGFLPIPFSDLFTLHILCRKLHI